MKTFLLALGFSLICASSQFDPAEITGDWCTIYMAADNVEKIGENAELRVHFRHLECSEGCNKLGLSFYSNFPKVIILRFEEISFSITDAGDNFFSIQYLTNDVIAFYNENVDEQGQVTHETLVAAKGNSLSEEELKKFEDLTVKMKIPKENIRNIIETDDCPAA
uniref:Lipocalin/cytosolic fatty-acid binding domain-containing protein n=1 Tax=Sciurus vulgaris TaxID=55149 RepID=A0A8D2DYC9_SCIVU